MGLQSRFMQIKNVGDQQDVCESQPLIWPLRGVYLISNHSPSVSGVWKDGGFQNMTGGGISSSGPDQSSLATVGSGIMTWSFPFPSLPVCGHLAPGELQLLLPASGCSPSELCMRVWLPVGVNQLGQHRLRRPQLESHLCQLLAI